ncbi:MAG: glycosyltransferase family 2 protein [Burkholderiales bacterium]|nr:glycosyltransferase family 2 protein [Burkholderiales bacterium]
MTAATSPSVSTPRVDASDVPLVVESVVPASLQVSIVTYRPEWPIFERCLRKLALAIGAAREDGTVRTVSVALVDNSEDKAIAAKVIELGKTRFADSGVQMTYVAGHANIGYGAAHNLALHGSGTDYHLVLNPDVELAADAIVNGVRWMNTHPDVGAIAPSVSRRDGTRDYLVKREPAIFDLFLRGFLPGIGRALFRRRLERYEMRDVVDADPDRDIIDVPAMSGACMLLRRAAVDRTGGFDPGFFLYFEDFDWTRRLNKITRTAYVPSFAIVHHGGGAARKGLKHIGHFTRGGWRYFRKHGFRWF